MARTAHRLGLRTNATMLYGHIETIDERLEHLDALRRCQDETGGFLAFIPLAYHPKNTELGGSGNTTVKCCSRLWYPLQFAKHAVCSFRYCQAIVRACVCVGAIIANC